MMQNHPCQTCGACCAFFRVSFHWSETLEVSHKVPEELTLQLNPYINVMKGTESLTPRCISLEGEVGGKNRCTIYENRPQPCRSFSASYEDGTNHESCDRARASKGLSPLTAEDWP